jgi:hypothetical protein
LRTQQEEKTRLFMLLKRVLADEQRRKAEQAQRDKQAQLEQELERQRQEQQQASQATYVPPPSQTTHAHAHHSNVSSGHGQNTILPRSGSAGASLFSFWFFFHTVCGEVRLTSSSESLFRYRLRLSA